MWRQRRDKVILTIEAGQTGLSTRKLVLESFGYNVLAAASCYEAQPLLEGHRIDAALLDTSANDMPLPEVSARIKALHGVPIILFGDAAFIPQDMENTVDAAIEKLGDPTETVKALDKLLNITDAPQASGKALDKP